MKHTAQNKKSGVDFNFKNHRDWQDHILQYRTEVTDTQSRQFLKEYFDLSALVPIVSLDYTLFPITVNEQCYSGGSRGAILIIPATLSHSL